MNIFRFNGEEYRYESFWAENGKKILDSNFKPLPTPKKGDNWTNKTIFLKKLGNIQKLNNLHLIYTNPKSCIICGKEEISTGLYSVNNVRWENGLNHYIEKHNVKPSDEFMHFTFNYGKKGNENKTIKVSGKKISTSKNISFVKLESDDILIFDALLEHGSRPIYGDKKFSEHFGFVDFNEDKIEKIIVSTNKKRLTVQDQNLYYPSDIPDILDYEFMFHTHPSTHGFGGRLEEGVLLEIPSIPDIFHFIDKYNKGKTQGSLIISPEGLYLIQKIPHDGKKININEKELYNSLSHIYNYDQSDFNNKYEDKYGQNISENIFYSEIAQDDSLINSVNTLLNKYSIIIYYYPRQYNKKTNNWIIPKVYLPLFVMELE